MILVITNYQMLFCEPLIPTSQEYRVGIENTSDSIAIRTLTALNLVKRFFQSDKRKTPAFPLLREPRELLFYALRFLPWSVLFSFFTGLEAKLSLERGNFPRCEGQDRIPLNSYLESKFQSLLLVPHFRMTQRYSFVLAVNLIQVTYAVFCLS